ncbi:transposon Tf2-1 polyprotein isoform X1 [Cucumis melo var. makuwa]|uniref:Transposon Tf2-1 polyprotein isoform X1 n=1 Tax=Cucumis melo var. makuwa TaxID=1194695 RepID=A0A5D3CS94_CUCMM|nr:transposon Tf2-1 polyprotein isoform X1 [Cucumis melo var. makuwa]
MESLEQEIAGIKKEMMKMPQAILSYMEANTKEQSLFSERMIESNMRETSAMKSKENEVTSSHDIGETSAERKTETDEILGDRNKFKKVEMLVFTGDDPDSLLFQTESLCGVVYQFCGWSERSGDNEGAAIQGKGVCESLEVKVSEWIVKEDFLSLELGGVDIILAPLTQLLKKGGFNWTKKAAEAFEKLKGAMMSLPVLALPKFDKPFEIETDASGYGVGVVLVQEKRPIAFYNHTLAVRDRGRPVTKDGLPNYWDTFEVEYKPGIENKATDALSRIPSTAQLCNMTAPVFLGLKVIKEEVEKDEKLQKIIAELSGDQTHQDGKFKIRSAVGGHSSFLHTYKRVAGELYWQGMRSAIKRYCAECLVCQHNKTLCLSRAGLLLPLDIPTQI